MLIDRLEKLGRLVLWLTLAAGCVIIPLEYGASQLAAVQQAGAVQKLEAKLAEAQKEPLGPERLSLKSMGSFIRGIDGKTATGYVWFTNASPRSGVVCIAGKAIHEPSGETASALQGCQHVDAYASPVQISVMFASAELNKLCEDGGCRLDVEDAPPD